VQNIFPDPERSYFPLFTQFGVHLEQRIRLGTTDHHFAFQEVLLIGGLEQGIAIPSFSLIIGFRFAFGLEFGLGPNIYLSAQNEGLGYPSLTPSFTVVYAIGYTFSFQGIHIPIDIAIVPTPADGHIRLSFLTGFNFFF